MLTQSELEWPATVPGAVNLLAILQGQHIVAGNLEYASLQCSWLLKCVKDTF